MDLISAGARLVVLEGPSAGVKLPLHDGAVLGRARRAELRIDDPLASRRHVRFTYRECRWTVADLASKNGFTVNGQPPEALAALSPGDRLGLGATVLTFEEGAGCVADLPARADSLASSPPLETPTRALVRSALRPPSVSSTRLLAAAALLALAAALVLAAARG